MSYKRFVRPTGQGFGGRSIGGARGLTTCPKAYRPRSPAALVWAGLFVILLGSSCRGARVTTVADGIPNGGDEPPAARFDGAWLDGAIEGLGPGDTVAFFVFVNDEARVVGPVASNSVTIPVLVPSGSGGYGEGTGSGGVAAGAGAGVSSTGTGDGSTTTGTGSGVSEAPTGFGVTQAGFGEGGARGPAGTGDQDTGSGIGGAIVGNGAGEAPPGSGTGSSEAAAGGGAAGEGHGLGRAETADGAGGARAAAGAGQSGSGEGQGSAVVGHGSSGHGAGFGMGFSQSGQPLVLRKIAPARPATPHTPVRVVVEVRNIGRRQMSGVRVDDIVDARLQVTTVEAGDCRGVTAGTLVTWVHDGILGPGAILRFSMFVIPADFPESPSWRSSRQTTGGPSR